MVGLPTGRRAFWRDEALRKTNPGREVLSTESQQVVFRRVFHHPCPSSANLQDLTPPPNSPLTHWMLTCFSQLQQRCFQPQTATTAPHTSWDIVCSPPRNELGSDLRCSCPVLSSALRSLTHKLLCK